MRTYGETTFLVALHAELVVHATDEGLNRNIRLWYYSRAGEIDTELWLRWVNEKDAVATEFIHQPTRQPLSQRLTEELFGA